MKALVPDPKTLVLHKVIKKGGRIEFHVTKNLPHAHCTHCHKMSRQIHGYYERTVNDLAWQNQQSVLIVGVRKFFCRNKSCSRKIFAEYFGTWVKKYGRRSQRLNDFLLKLSLMSGGQGGEYLAKTMGYPWSADTLLREIHRAKYPPIGKLTVVGVDDFAFRKGQTYGTILVDLEKRCPIDLLPDRKEETLTKWLEKFPEIKIMTRDRAGAYAKAGKKGAPQAVQVADRWHLMKNSGDMLARYLSNHIQVLSQSYAMTIQDEKAETGGKDLELDHVQKKDPSLTNASQADKLTTSERNRLERSTQARKLIESGKSIRAISKELGWARKTVRKYRDQEFPHLTRSRKYSSGINPYIPFLEKHWGKGNHNATDLWRKLVKKGYQGAASTVRSYLKSWRKTDEIVGKNPIMPNGYKRKCPSPKTLAILITRKKNERTDRENRLIGHLYMLSPEIEWLAKVGRQFLALLREKRVDLFPQWLKKVKKCKIPVLKRFARMLLRDRTAIEEAMKTHWSNGQTEGQVNRLKVIKRQMYGRAGYELLKKRVILSF